MFSLFDNNDLAEAEGILTSAGISNDGIRHADEINHALNTINSLKNGQINTPQDAKEAIATMLVL